MYNQNPEIYFVTVIGIILGLLLVGFIVTTLFLYQRRQQRQEQEMERLRDMYEKEALRSQLEIQENTLKTIAQELHDNIGQMLSVVKLSLSMVPTNKELPGHEQIKNSQEVLNKAIIDLSSLTKGLHSDRIAQIGLAESVRSELYSVKKAGLVDVDFKQLGSEIFFDDQKSIFLFRIFQEALNNIIKHARATEVSVHLSFSDTIFVMEITDNGVGFNVAEKRSSTNASTGVGLKSLYNRAKLIGADLSIDSTAGSGTTLLIELPLETEHV
jgi:signal transduction histidine kinase